MALLPPNRYNPGDIKKPTPQSPNIYGGGGSTGGMGGMQQGPVPWWQTSQGAGDRVGNLQRSAPSGYEYDPVQMGYVPTTSTPAYKQKQLETERQRQDLAFQQQQQDYYTNNARQARGDQRTEEAFNLRMSAMRGLQGSAGAIGGGGGGFPTGTSSPSSYAVPAQVSMTTGGGAYPSVINMPGIPDASAAQNAAFGHAKAQAGSMGRAAVDSLRSNLAERGIMGGGTEARGLVDRLAAATNPLSDLNVAQQQERLGIAQHGQDLGAQQALAQYQGGITQRGQDLSQAATQYSGGITQRGQDIQDRQAQAQLAQQRQLEQMRMLQQALAGLSTSY